MGDILRYIGLLLNRAAQKSVLLTDRLTILIVPFSTLVLWLTGAKMTDTIQETVFVGVAITVAAVIVLRLIAASYFVWKEDRSKIVSLRKALDSPRFREKKVMNEHRLKLRKELGDRLSFLITYAEARAKVVDSYVIYNEGEQRFAENFIRAKEIISQLSYDVALRVVCLNLVKLTTDIATNGLTDVTEQGRSASLDRLWAQRKLTFKLLHRQDVAEILTLAEVASLINEHGEDFGSDVLDDLKTLLKENPWLASDERMAIE